MAQWWLERWRRWKHTQGILWYYQIYVINTSPHNTHRLPPLGCGLVALHCSPCGENPFYQQRKFLHYHRLHGRRHLQQRRWKYGITWLGIPKCVVLGGDEKVKEDLFALMEEMNTAAWLDFARSVRWAEMKWMAYFQHAHGSTSDDEISSIL